MRSRAPLIWMNFTPQNNWIRVMYTSILHFHGTKNGIINIYRSWKINLCEICLRTGVGRRQPHCWNNNATQSTAAAAPFKFPNKRNVSNFVRLLSIQRNDFTRRRCKLFGRLSARLPHSNAIRWNYSMNTNFFYCFVFAMGVCVRLFPCMGQPITITLCVEWPIRCRDAGVIGCASCIHCFALDANDVIWCAVVVVIVAAVSIEPINQKPINNLTQSFVTNCLSAYLLWIIE